MVMIHMASVSAGGNLGSTKTIVQVVASAHVEIVQKRMHAGTHPFR